MGKGEKENHSEATLESSDSIHWRALGSSLVQWLAVRYMIFHLVFLYCYSLLSEPCLTLPPSPHHWLLSLNEPLVPIDELACSDVYLLFVKFVYTHFAG